MQSDVPRNGACTQQLLVYMHHNSAVGTNEASVSGPRKAILQMSRKYAMRAGALTVYHNNPNPDM